MICPHCHHRLDRLPYAKLAPLIENRPVSIKKFAAIAGIERTQIHRWKQRGWLSLDHAEMVADALNVHPSAIWPEYMELAAS